MFSCFINIFLWSRLLIIFVHYYVFFLITFFSIYHSFSACVDYLGLYFLLILLKTENNFINIRKVQAGEAERYYLCEVSRGSWAKNVTVKSTGCGLDLHFRTYLIKFIFLFLSRSEKWGTECFDTMFLLAYPAACGIQCEADLI